MSANRELFKAKVILLLAVVPVEVANLIWPRFLFSHELPWNAYEESLLAAMLASVKSSVRCFVCSCIDCVCLIAFF